MRLRFKQLIAVWFVLQIVLPFTAPLQTCDLRDLLGTKAHHSHPVVPESSATPTTNQIEAAASSCDSPLDASIWIAAAGRVAGGDPASALRLVAARDLSPSSQPHRTVLRL